MDPLNIWLEQIELWYQTRKHDQGSNLESLILYPPDQVWGPIISERQSKAIACWLDGCLRLFQYQRYQRPDKAYQYLQFAYSKLQQVTINPQSELELKDWCMKRMQNLIVLSLEFCTQQPNERWQAESSLLIENHVRFMAAQQWNEPRKYDQGKSSFH